MFRIVIALTLVCSCLHALGQSRNLSLGATAGTGVVASSFRNMLALNQELGVALRYEKDASPFTLQINTLWCRRSVRGVFAHYTGSEAMGYYSFKPIYGCFEHSLQVNYTLKEEPNKKLNIFGGLGYNFTRFARLKERFWFQGPTYVAGVEDFTAHWNEARMSGLSLLFGISIE